GCDEGKESRSGDEFKTNNASCSDTEFHRTSSPCFSKEHFYCELNLARRAEFSCWEPRARNATKIRTADDVPGLPKVRVIKEVEQFGAELHACPFAKYCVLDYRQVRVIEGRSDDHIASQTAEALDRHKHGRVEPAIDVTDHVYRSGNVGPKGVSDPVYNAVVGDNIYRAAALRLDDRAELPTCNEPVAFER